MKAAAFWTIAAVVGGCAYLVHCVVRPQKDCWCCKGKGIHRSEWFPALSRRCWWCKSSGPRRDRFGTRLWKRRRRKAGRAVG